MKQRKLTEIKQASGLMDNFKHFWIHEIVEEEKQEGQNKTKQKHLIKQW